MMNKKILLFSVIMLAVCSLKVFSESHFIENFKENGLYVSVGTGIVMVPGLNDSPHELFGALRDAVSNESSADWTFDVGFGLGGTVGYDFGNVRTDLEFSYLSAKFVFDHEADDKLVSDHEADDKFTALSILANVWFDLDTGCHWTPFIGAGVGIINPSVALNEGGLDFDGSAWGFAYQAGGGLAFEVAQGLSLYAAYQFIGTLETTITESEDASDSSLSPSPTANRIQIGLRYQS